MSTAMNVSAPQRTRRPLPLTFDELDGEWLTQALETQAPGAVVNHFEIVDVVHGNCTKVRLRLDMNEAGRRAGIPETVILKTGFESHSRAAGFALQVEPMAYRDIMPTSGLNGPRCYFADFDGERIQGATIMEDLGNRNVTFGTPLQARSQDDIAATLSLLAHYHSQTWGCADFAPGSPLDWVKTAAPFTRPVPRSWLEAVNWDQFLEMPRAAAFSTRFQDRLWAIDALNRVEILSRQVPNCVIHGDSHIGNVFFEPDGTPGFYDITPRRAPAMGEVCNHIVLALDMADRPRWERALVQHYLDELGRRGAADVPSLDDAMRQYSVFLVETYGTVITNRAAVMAESWITAYAARCSAAMLDNDTIARVREID